MTTPMYRTVKPFGKGGAHLTVPKSWVDERVVVVHEDMLDELADCVAAFIMTTGAEPSTALASLVDFDADDIARGLDFHEKYVEAR